MNTAPPPPNTALALWHRLSTLPMGKWLFSQAVCVKAPYFGSISPRFAELRAGYCRVTLAKRRRVHNHIGTVHAIAICNLAEAAAGTLCEATVPRTHRWIPKGMTVEYLRKAASDLVAVATLDPLPAFDASAADVPVAVEVTDRDQHVVVRATIMMRISPRKAAS